MKKLVIMALAAVGLTMATQAASVNWQTGGQYIYGSDGALATPGWLVQLVFLGPDAAAGTPLQMGDDTVVMTKAIGDGIAKTALRPGNFTGSPFDYVFGVTAVNGHVLTTGDQFLIRVFNAPTEEAATEWLDVGTITLSATDNSGADEIIFGTPVGNTPGQWQAVPEPTAFALLGLGVAALALRRRMK